MKSDKTIIRSRYTERVTTTTEPGRPMHNKYQIRIDEQGHKELVKIGEENLQAIINADAESCDIGKILQQYKDGDVNALNRAKAGYVDLTTTPKNLIEAQNTIITLKEEFNSLPLDIRRQFDHSPEKYVQEYGSKKWKELIMPDKPKNETPGVEVRKDAPDNTGKETTKNE